MDTTASLQLAPTAMSLVEGDTARLRAQVVDSHGLPMDSVRPLWSSSDTAVVRVDSAGRLLALAPGRADVFARVGNRAAFASVKVSLAVLVGAGDIASCGSAGDEATAALLDSIPGTVFTVGDNVYDSGTSQEFADCYEPSWGKHRGRTRPSPGNHDYATPDAQGYYAYFGAAAGEVGKGYYSYDLGAWHVIALNSNLDVSAGSAQEVWLREDLRAHPTRCALAYWHHPRFSSGPHGSDARLTPLWRALYDAGAEVVIVGHDHTYERFAPQTPDGAPDTMRGIREFVAGTGGRSFYEFPAVQPNSEVRANTAFGVLMLVLHPTSYEWKFVPQAGAAFADSGKSACR